MNSSFIKQRLDFGGTTRAKDPADRVHDEGNGKGSAKKNKFTDHSNIKVAGGKAAGPKPIKANYDADDARIVDLKQQGWTDEYVARKLAEEGRIRYVGRTVGSRWLRIRKALEAKEEEILEDEMSDWHEGEDDHLDQAVKEIDAKIEKEIEKLQEKKWQQVASHFAELISRKKYTAKLCRERHEGLMNGTALLPIELDSDQEGRATMRSERVARNKRLREEAAAAHELEEAERKAAREAKKESRAANVVIKITKAQQKKMDEEKIAKMKKFATAERKSQKIIVRQWAAYNKVEAMWLVRKQNMERKCCNKLLGLPLSYRPSRVKQYADANDQITDTEDGSDADDNSITVTSTSTGKHRRVSASGSDTLGPNKKKNKPTTRKDCGLVSPRTTRSMSPKHIAIGEAEVTTETRASPRAVMTLAELDQVLVRRDLTRPSNHETQEQVVARLFMEDKQSTAKALGELLRSAGLRPSGTKESKIVALQEYDASRSAGGDA